MINVQIHPRTVHFALPGMRYPMMQASESPPPGGVHRSLVIGPGSGRGLAGRSAGAGRRHGFQRDHRLVQPVQPEVGLGKTHAPPARRPGQVRRGLHHEADDRPDAVTAGGAGPCPAAGPCRRSPDPACPGGGAPVPPGTGRSATPGSPCGAASAGTGPLGAAPNHQLVLHPLPSARTVGGEEGFLLHADVRPRRVGKSLDLFQHGPFHRSLVRLIE